MCRWTEANGGSLPFKDTLSSEIENNDTFSTCKKCRKSSTKLLLAQSISRITFNFLEKYMYSTKTAFLMRNYRWWSNRFPKAFHCHETNMEFLKRKRKSSHKYFAMVNDHQLHRRISKWIWIRDYTVYTNQWYFSFFSFRYWEMRRDMRWLLFITGMYAKYAINVQRVKKMISDIIKNDQKCQ